MSHKILSHYPLVLPMPRRNVSKKAHSLGHPLFGFKLGFECLMLGVANTVNTMIQLWSCSKNCLEMPKSHGISLLERVVELAIIGPINPLQVNSSVVKWPPSKIERVIWPTKLE